MTLRILLALSLTASLVGCADGSADPQVVTESVATTTLPLLTTTSSAQTTTSTAPVMAAGGAALGGSGPRGVGRASYQTTDASRSSRLIPVTAYYPALTDSTTPIDGAAADPSGAPYPVVVVDAVVGPIFGPHLASHGFVVLSLQDHSLAALTGAWMVDFPLDKVAALDALDSLDDHALAGLADTGRAGALGYSFGSWDALMLAGARVDPAYYQASCAGRTDSWYFVCRDSREWETMSARAAELGLIAPDGLWSPFGDERFLAVMPMAPEGFDLIGPTGLAAATADALFIGAGSDRDNVYDPATTSLFRNYPQSQLITFVGADHSMIFDAGAVQQMRRFAVAFFGVHLDGRSGFAQYLTEEFVESVAPDLSPSSLVETLKWGIAP